MKMFATKRFTVHERAPQRVYTKDALLTPPTREELAENQRRTARMSGLELGRIWAGDLREKLDGIRDRAKVADALSSLMGALAEYGNERGKSEPQAGPAGSLAFQGEDAESEPQEAGWALSTKATPDSLNRANEKFWADRLSRPSTMDSARPSLSTTATPDSINRANARFWDKIRGEQSMPGWGRR
jgi:hypothetical protein